MHLQDTADTFAFALSGVIYIGTGFKSTGIYAEECEFTYIRVSHDFECESCKRFFITGRAFIFFTGFRVNAFDVRNVGRSRHECNNCIKQRLNAFVFIRRTTANRSHFAGNGLFADACHDFFFGEFFAFKIFHHQVVIAFSNCFDKSLTVFFGFSFISSGISTNSSSLPSLSP